MDALSANQEWLSSMETVSLVLLTARSATRMVVPSANKASSKRTESAIVVHQIAKHVERLGA